ncbi:lysophospholipid acyltransferase family protein [Limnohabitans sp. TEGF004]|jgi:KDO2-lipid IV(A) lauroyltransferase|uniref:lysophospholipid acyltransferase family protein n=1 Tax=Limnohabitans sp. TEGF004 TaxID=2986281 RepID=UPI002377386F|nr:lysophospholipid acyltransferase family protein [Limnohabitans sp. TEGF004]BDU56587.1 acyltransferase [Limnohabitans sp. TEGF004]
MSLTTRIFHFLARLPLPLMQRLGAVLGWLVWWLSPGYRRNFKANVHAAGVAWRDARPAVAAIGAMVAELPWVWMRPHETKLDGLMKWDGAEHFEAAMQAGKGAIIMSPHLGSWEIGAQAIAEKFGPTYGPMVALFRPARKAWLEPLVANARTRPYLDSAPTSLAGVRTLIRALRNGGYTAILPDQVPPLGQGVWAPFFGRDVYTMTLLAKLAQQTGAQVIMTWCERLPAGQGFCMHMRPFDAPEMKDTNVSPEVAAAAVNRGVESMVLDAPGQYLWGYARDKQPRAEG